MIKIGLTSSGIALTLAIGICAGCSSGGGGSGGTCNKVSPCGGNIVGTWKIVDSCASGAPNAGGANCPSATSQINSFSVSGTATFSTDGSYSNSTNNSSSVTLGVPMSCLMGATCNDLASSLNTGAAAGSTANCTSAGSNCNCTLSGTSQTTETGSYTVSGSTITTNPAGGQGPNTSSYCVQGNTLHFMMANGGVMEDIVATRQ